MIAPTPYNRAIAIVPSDTVNIDGQGGRGMLGFFVGVTGNVAVAFQDGTATVLKGCIAGTIYPIKVIRINSTSTTATDLVALYQV